ADVPSFHEPTVAMPDAFVVCEPPVREPPPELIEKVTPTPETGLPYWSVTSTEGADETFVSTVALWWSPPLTAIDAALSATPVAWNVTEPTEAVAVSEFEPAVVASVQDPTVATPVASVVAFPPLLKETPTPATGLP